MLRPSCSITWEFKELQSWQSSFREARSWKVVVTLAARGLCSPKTPLWRQHSWASLVAQRVKRLPTKQETWVWSLGWDNPLEKEMAVHSRTLAWKIPRMEEPGRLQSTGSWQVRRGWVTLISLFTFTHWRRKWQPTPVFLPERSQGRRSLVGCRLWGRTELDTTEATAAAAAAYFTDTGFFFFNDF